MSNYAQTTFFTPKDALPAGNPAKTLYGAAFDVEFGNIVTALATKYDASTFASANVALLNTANVFTAAQTANSFIPTSASVPVNGMYLSAANTLAFASNTKVRGTINSNGGWGIPVPDSGFTLTLNAIAGSAPLKLVCGATDPALYIVGSYQTGAHTATFTATNKPGSGTTAPTQWLTVSLGGSTFFIPMWA